MYCKHCGQIIDENSKFCSHCGKSQDNSNKSLTNKPVWIIYLIWTLANLYLLMGEKEEDCAIFFYPFTTGERLFTNYLPSYGYWLKEFYDFSEFIVYVFIIPVILYIVYRRYSKQIDKIVNKILNSR